eukprot:746901-Hanusia_phi.AAC.4
MVNGCDFGDVDAKVRGGGGGGGGRRRKIKQERMQRISSTEGAGLLVLATKVVETFVYRSSTLGFTRSTIGCVLRLRGGKIHPSLYPWLLTSKVNLFHHGGLVILNAMQTPDYYGDLGVRMNASTEEIREAYKALVLSYHPDRSSRGSNFLDSEGDCNENTSNDESKSRAERFIEVREAWEVLGDEEARRAYDLFMSDNWEMKNPHTPCKDMQSTGIPVPLEPSTSQFSFGKKNRVGFF